MAATRLYGPVAAAAAALATAVSSLAPSPPEKFHHLGPAPYLLYAAHPSMPVPPLPDCNENNPISPSPSLNESKNTSIDPVLGSPSKSSVDLDQVVSAVHTLVSNSIKTSSLHFFPIFPKVAMLDGSLLLRSTASQGHYTDVVSTFSSPPTMTKPSYPSIFSPSFAASKYIRSWHSKRSSKPQGSGDETETEKKDGSRKEVTVVLLGWLGAKQKHLKKYADWYTERGINAVTFVIPMSDMISFKAGGKAEQQIDQLAHHLLAWMEEEDDGKEKHLFFHTFSNTGWLTYGVLLERMLQKNNKLLDKVKGCVVDSAPVAEPDPQVWASGFSAAFLKKKSVAARKIEVSEILKDNSTDQVKADVAEQALVSMLETFFSLFLRLPYVKKRLSEVVAILSQQQPRCPQLYMYSSADRVIPARFVESFMEEQRRTGRVVKACNLVWSPHVDHFRSFPDVYSSQLNSFIHECLFSHWPSPQKCA